LENWQNSEKIPLKKYLISKLIYNKNFNFINKLK
jgi:hypothetical protein